MVFISNIFLNNVATLNIFLLIIIVFLLTTWDNLQRVIGMMKWMKSSPQKVIGVDAHLQRHTHCWFSLFFSPFASAEQWVHLALIKSSVDATGQIIHRVVWLCGGNMQREFSSPTRITMRHRARAVSRLLYWYSTATERIPVFHYWQRALCCGRERKKSAKPRAIFALFVASPTGTGSNAIPLFHRNRPCCQFE